MKTDWQIQRAVTAELQWEQAVDAAAIRVEVRHGVVTLAGTVGHFSSKCDVQCAALRVPGVTALVMKIDVNATSSRSKTDSDIVRSARDMLWAGDASSCPVRLKVKQGRITLSGAVTWDHQRCEAAGVIRRLPGVQGVENRITLRSGIPANVLKSHIQAALRQGPGDPTRIGVSVRGAEVTLTGSVQTWSERDFAENSAWTTPGVRYVIDQMTITSN